MRALCGPTAAQPYVEPLIICKVIHLWVPKTYLRVQINLAVLLTPWSCCGVLRTPEPARRSTICVTMGHHKRGERTIGAAVWHPHRPSSPASYSPGQAVPLDHVAESDTIK